MTVALERLATFRGLAFARLGRDGTLLAANDAFLRLFGGRAPSVGAGAALHFHSPTFAALRSAGQGDDDVLHDGTVDLGLPGETAVSTRALVLRRGETLVLLAEVDQPAYHAALQEVVTLNVELAELQREQRRTIARLERTESALREALSQVKTLRGLLPICVRCKKIKNDAGTWEKLESYVESHSEAQLSHGLCQDCLAEEERRA